MYEIVISLIILDPEGNTLKKLVLLIRIRIMLSQRTCTRRAIILVEKYPATYGSDHSIPR